MTEVTSGVKKTFAKFKGRFGKKKKNKETEATATPVAETTPVATEWVQMFDLRLETEKIGEKQTDGSEFSEPTHLKKVESLGFSFSG